MKVARNGIVEVIPGLYQIRLPMPIKTLDTVFVYLARSGEHNLLIDTGWNTDDAYDALVSAFDQINFSIEELEVVIISHLHPDHFGLSKRIKIKAPEAKFFMHFADAASLRNTIEEYKSFIIDLCKWIGIHGASREEVKAMLSASIPMARFIMPAQPDKLLRGGEIIPVGNKWRFEVISTPGHTAGNICLYDRGNSKVFFSGDHILPTITPNISLTPAHDGDPLGEYIDSLNSLRDLRVSRILPSHEYIFTGLNKRIREIESHHRERLEEISNVLTRAGDPQSAFQIASKLHWHADSWIKLGPWEKRAAVMETLAHLEYLKRRGKIAMIEKYLLGSRKISFTSLVYTKQAKIRH